MRRRQCLSQRGMKCRAAQSAKFGIYASSFTSTSRIAEQPLSVDVLVRYPCPERLPVGPSSQSGVPSGQTDYGTVTIDGTAALIDALLGRRPQPN